MKNIVPKPTFDDPSLEQFNVSFNVSIAAKSQDDVIRALARYFSKMARAIDAGLKEAIDHPFIDPPTLAISNIADFKTADEHEQYYGLEEDEEAERLQ